ncbi:hypothetical protein ACEWGF_02515, partial [Vibrio diabolicus]|uniref:hypothetical protein n=1 Tax=Vibrio diabolicus TaxID=50719 RepID=UPI0035A909CE
YLYFSGLKLLRSMFFAPLAVRRVASANPHCQPKFLNHSGRKTCQYPWVASLSGRGGRFQV